MKLTAKDGYLWGKLASAISSAMFRNDVETMAAVFHDLSLGLENDPKAAYLTDETGAALAATIQRLITPSAEDMASPAAAAQGGWRVLAARMTEDERDELAHAMWELFGHISEH